MAVQSGSIVIGYVTFTAQTLIDHPVDKFGLTEIEAFLTSGKAKGYDSVGRIRLVMRLEAHDHDDDDEDDSDESAMSDIDLSSYAVPVLHNAAPSTRKKTGGEYRSTGIHKHQYTLR